MIMGFTHEQGIRVSNQDALLLRCSLLAHGELCMAAVCDGMGGEDAGELASFLCIKALDKWFDTTVVPLFEEEENLFLLTMNLKAKAFRIFHDINDKLFEKMRLEHVKLGTTATVVIVYGYFYWIFHIGDSRIYFAKQFFHKTYFFRKTKDHSNERGLHRCLGLNREFAPDFICGVFIRRNGILLCTDGFWHCYDNERWGECMNLLKMTTEPVIKKRLKELADDNLRRGERDNMTALFFARERKRGIIWKNTK